MILWVFLFPFRKKYQNVSEPDQWIIAASVKVRKEKNLRFMGNIEKNNDNSNDNDNDNDNIDE